MRKIIMLLSSISFISTSTLSVVACGVQNDSKITTDVQAPQQAKNGEDPLTSYVYNNTYLYANESVAAVISTGGQLAADKIKDDNGTTLNTSIWKDFYKSDGYISDSYTTFGLDNKDYDTARQKEFSYKGARGEDLFFWLPTNNDASLDKNKSRVYWFVASDIVWEKGSTTYNPDANNLVVPNLSDFSDSTKKIVRSLYIHMYMLIPGFRIDFSAKIDITFQTVIDKSGIKFVALNIDTIKKPFGDVSWDNPAPAYNDRINNLSIETQ